MSRCRERSVGPWPIEDHQTEQALNERDCDEDRQQRASAVRGMSVIPKSQQREDANDVQRELDEEEAHKEHLQAMVVEPSRSMQSLPSGRIRVFLPSELEDKVCWADCSGPHLYLLSSVVKPSRMNLAETCCLPSIYLLSIRVPNTSVPGNAHYGSFTHSTLCPVLKKVSPNICYVTLLKSQG